MREHGYLYVPEAGVKRDEVLSEQTGKVGGLAYRRYALGIITLVYSLSWVDRCLISLLLQPIKQDLNLSDTQLGFITGLAFAVFYTTLGIPIARWADSGNRVTITSMAVAVWSGTVMCCLLVKSFTQLVCARIVAGAGEAGCMPPTYSLLGDYFTRPTERARAMSIYWLASPLAVLLSFIGGGWLNDLYGWRRTFFIMGIPGLLLALVVKLTLKEPRVVNGQSCTTLRLPNVSDVLRTLWSNRSLRHLTAALVLFFTLSQGMNPWYAAFLIRNHGMNTSELGLWLGLIFGLGSIAGIGLGGYVSTRWCAQNERRQMRLSAVAFASVVPCFVLFLLLPKKAEALFALVALAVVFNFLFGPSFALLQRLVADEVRATTLAVVMLLANLIGMGVGPQVVGALSDLLEPLARDQSLRFAMLIMASTALWAAYHFWQVGESVTQDLALISSHERTAR